MPRYKCEPCDFTTCNRTNYGKHCSTSKHLNKVALTSTSSIMQHPSSFTLIPSSKNAYKCKYCLKSYSRKDNAKRHERACDIRNQCDKTANCSFEEMSEDEQKSDSDSSSTDNTPIIHPKKEMSNSVECKPRHFCHYCDFPFSRADSLKRHEAKCAEKRIKSMSSDAEIDKYKREIKFKDTELIHYRQELEYYKNILNIAGGMANKAVSSLTHIVKNYDDAPPLEKIDLDEIRKLKNGEMLSLKDYEMKLIDEVFYAFNHGIMGQYVGDIIIALYKKNDPSVQSMWNTDPSRLTYLIKKIIHNDSDKSKWIIDKKGVETVEYVITPIVEKIKCLASVFRLDNCPDENDDNYDYESLDHDRIMRINTIYVELMAAIDDRKVHQDILKYISSHFYFNKDTIEDK